MEEREKQAKQGRKGVRENWGENLNQNYDISKISTFPFISLKEKKSREFSRISMDVRKRTKILLISSFQNLGYEKF